MEAHEKLIEYRNRYINQADERIKQNYLSLIDSVLDEWNNLRRKIEEYEKRENEAQFFRQFEETYLTRDTMRDIENMRLELKDWLFSLYKYSMYNDRYFLEPKKKAEEIEMLIDLAAHFERKIDNIVGNFSYIKTLWNLYYRKIKELPITEQILVTTNNKLLDRFEEIKTLFKNKYGNCFSFCHKDKEIEQVLRSSYQIYINKYIDHIKCLHNKLIPPKKNIEATITKDGIVVLEKPKIATIEVSKKPTKLDYLIDNLFNMPDEVLNDDEWWQDLFYNELAI